MTIPVHNSRFWWDVTISIPDPGCYNKNGNLRGCIGSVYPTKPLILDLIDNAKNAAFHDPRFNPVTPQELANIQVSVSILSSIEKIDFKDERDLLSKIYPHGIILSERDRRAVYLPIVWEQLPDKTVFLNFIILSF